MSGDDFNPNAGLLRQTLAVIEQNPTRWNQGIWSTLAETEDVVLDKNQDVVGAKVDCETAFCFAGWAATLNEGVWVGSAHLLAVPDDDHVTTKSVWPISDDGEALSGDRLVEVQACPAWARAQRLLGLDTGCADTLFDGSNTITTLREMVEELANGNHIWGCEQHPDY